MEKTSHWTGEQGVDRLLTDASGQRPCNYCALDLSSLEALLMRHSAMSHLLQPAVLWTYSVKTMRVTYMPMRI